MLFMHTFHTSMMNIDLKQENLTLFISNRLRIISVTHKFSQWQNNCQDGLLMKEEDRKKITCPSRRMYLFKYK